MAVDAGEPPLEELHRRHKILCVRQLLNDLKEELKLDILNGLNKLNESILFVTITLACIFIIYILIKSMFISSHYEQKEFKKGIMNSLTMKDKLRQAWDKLFEKKD